jgi:hypothetical protein
VIVLRVGHSGCCERARAYPLPVNAPSVFTPERLQDGDVRATCVALGLAPADHRNRVLWLSVGAQFRQLIGGALNA